MPRIILTIAAVVVCALVLTLTSVTATQGNIVDDNTIAIQQSASVRDNSQCTTSCYDEYQSEIDTCPKCNGEALAQYQLCCAECGLTLKAAIGVSSIAVQQSRQSIMRKKQRHAVTRPVVRRVRNSVSDNSCDDTCNSQYQANLRGCFGSQDCIIQCVYDYQACEAACPKK